MEQLLEEPGWMQVFVLWAVLSAPLNLFGMVLLYRMEKRRDHGFDEDKLRGIAHAQALITYAELEERRRYKDTDSRFERLLM